MHDAFAYTMLLEQPKSVAADLRQRHGQGEKLTRAIGRRPSGAPWRVGLEDPRSPGCIAEQIAIVNRAVATSGGYGTQFDPGGRFNHLFEPSTGRSSWRYLSVSVIAPDATAADALSTGFSLMPYEAIRSVATKLGVETHLVMPNGDRVAVAAGQVARTPRLVVRVFEERIILRSAIAKHHLLSQDYAISGGRRQRRSTHQPEPRVDLYQCAADDIAVNMFAYVATGLDCALRSRP